MMWVKRTIETEKTISCDCHWVQDETEAQQWINLQLVDYSISGWNVLEKENLIWSQYGVVVQYEIGSNSQYDYDLISKMRKSNE